MKSLRIINAIAIIVVLISQVVLCYGEELLNPYCFGGFYCVETSILREPKNGLPPFSEMIFDPGCYINSWSCPNSVIWENQIKELTYFPYNTVTGLTHELTVDAEQIKTICIHHLDATRCADSLLMWELISKMEETK